MYNEFYIYVDIFTLILSLFWATKNIKNIVVSSRYIIYYFFFCFYILPLFLDYTIGFPKYVHDRRLFSLAEFDNISRIIYDFAIIYLQYILLYFKKKIFRRNVETISASKTTILNFFYWFGLLSPIIFVFVYSMPLFITYVPMWRETGLRLNIDNYLYAEKASYVAISSSIFLLFSGNNRSKVSFILKIAIICLTYISICIEGKRSVLFFLLLNLFVIVLPGIRNSNYFKFNVKKIFIIGILLTLIVFVLTNLSASVMSSRNVDDDFELRYMLQRIDYFRDDRARFVIYSMLHPNEVHLLNYPGETLWPFLSWTWPTNFFFQYFQIPQSRFSVILSNALVGNMVIDNEVNFMTPDLYSELIANIGALAFVLYPFICLWFAKLADRNPYPFNALIIICFIALTMYSPSYVAYLLEMAIIMYFIVRRTRRNIIPQ